MKSVVFVCEVEEMDRSDGNSEKGFLEEKVVGRDSISTTEK